MLCLPLLDDRDLGTPLEPKLPLCVGALQLVNKLPSNVTPPATFQFKDVHAGRSFCNKLTRVIEHALPLMLEKEARARDELARVRRKKKRCAVGHRRGEHHPRHHH